MLLLHFGVSLPQSWRLLHRSATEMMMEPLRPDFMYRCWCLYRSYWSINILEIHICCTREALQKIIIQTVADSARFLQHVLLALKRQNQNAITSDHFSPLQALFTAIVRRIVMIQFLESGARSKLRFPCFSLLCCSRISARLCGATVLGGSVRPNSCQLLRALLAAPIWWLNTWCSACVRMCGYGDVFG